MCFWIHCIFLKLVICIWYDEKLTAQTHYPLPRVTHWSSWNSYPKFRPKVVPVRKNKDFIPIEKRHRELILVNIRFVSKKRVIIFWQEEDCWGWWSTVRELGNVIRRCCPQCIVHWLCVSIKSMTDKSTGISKNI